MATKRRVTCVNHDRDGDVTHIGNKTEWGIVDKQTAIAQIESGTYHYYVCQPGTNPTAIEVVSGPTGKYLRTVADGQKANNLDNLSEC